MSLARFIACGAQIHRASRVFLGMFTANTSRVLSNSLRYKSKCTFVKSISLHVESKYTVCHEPFAAYQEQCTVCTEWSTA